MHLLSFKSGLHKFPINLGATFKTKSQNINGNNIHVNLFANAEAATYMMESEPRDVNLKMLHNNMQRYKIRIIR
jgi:hypothetical protein